jgi:hypothetical protein
VGGVVLDVLHVFPSSGDEGGAKKATSSGAEGGPNPLRDGHVNIRPNSRR